MEKLFSLRHLGGDKGGHLELIRKGFKNFNMNNINIPENIKQRGLDDVNTVS